MVGRGGLILVTLIGASLLVTGLLLTEAAKAGQDAQSCAVPGNYATIQAAVDDAGCSLIEVGSGTFGENVVISRTVRIEGQGAENTIVDGGGNDDVFKIHAWGEMSRPVSVTVTLDGLSIVNGKSGIVSEASTVNCIYGAGYANLTVKISQCAINNNSNSGIQNGPYDKGQTDVRVFDSRVSGNLGWGIENAPDLHGTANLTVANSVISDNSGGGIGNWGCIKGLCETTLDVSDSSVSSNSGSGIENWVTVATVTKSTINGNTADEGGGMNNGVGAGVTVTNSTISGNRAGKGGGISSICGSTHLKNSTISGNSAVSGGGIYVLGEDDPYVPHACYGFVQAIHTVVANSEEGGECVVINDEYAGFIDKGHNIVEDGSCITADSSRAGDPLLGPLARNGGHTPTHALLPGSVAIDGGDMADCPEKDQRGYSRPADGDGDGTAECDIGAFELRHFVSSFRLPVVAEGTIIN